MATAKATVDHDQIRDWVEARGGHPARVKRTGSRKDPGVLRIDFPGFSGEDTLEEIGWDEFFEWFDRNELALLLSDEEGNRFNKLVSRETAAASRSAAASRKRAASSRKASAKASAKKPSGGRAARSSGAKKASSKKASASTKTASSGRKASSSKKTAKKASSSARKASAPAKSSAKRAAPAKKASSAKKVASSTRKASATKASSSTRRPAGAAATRKASAKKASAKKATAKKTTAKKAGGNVTTDHDEIRRWVEARGGFPAHVRQTGRKRGDLGVLRIDYPGYSGKDTLERVDWEDWFAAFDRNRLAFLHDDKRNSRFSKLVNR